MAHSSCVVCAQEEEDLVNAHRQQVEDTMNIVREVRDSMTLNGGITF